MPVVAYAPTTDIDQPLAMAQIQQWSLSSLLAYVCKDGVKIIWQRWAMVSASRPSFG
jgi:hypothetical protein